MKSSTLLNFLNKTENFTTQQFSVIVQVGTFTYVDTELVEVYANEKNVYLNVVHNESSEPSSTEKLLAVLNSNKNKDIVVSYTDETGQLYELRDEDISLGDIGHSDNHYYFESSIY